MKRFFVVLLHIVCWLVLLALPTLFRPYAPLRNGFDIFSDIFTGPRLPNNLLLIAVFYLNYHVIIPRFYFKKYYILVIAFVLMCFGALLLLNYNLTLQMDQKMVQAANAGRVMGQQPGTAMLPTFRYVGPDYNLFLLIIVLVLSFSLRIYGQMRKLNDEKLSTEIAFLKAQINPHFLFNTLNSIYSLTLSNSEAAPEAVVKLSGIMRYAISDTTKELVALEREITYISNYVDLQTMRAGDKAKIECVIKGSPSGKQIAPFILIPFVENAFKYGVNPEEDSDIQVNIWMDKKKVMMGVHNKKVFIRSDKDTGTGLGINTTIQRLGLVYPGKHSLTIDDNEKNFNVSLEIDLA
ncbi:MAG: sensor histidine kinase [Flavipsychrobacter sp.]|nr:sensor histidine kinase [Flavipsychrobacter sp.]